VSYPSDGDFPPPPDSPAFSPTRWHLDLDIGPLVTYELGQLFSPVQLRVELEPRLRWNPWPGALASAAIVLPLQNDFQPSTFEPDLDLVRPGPVSFEQFAWLPGVALLSVSAGYFGEQRYGGSLGLARPLHEGEFLLDAQADLTGFVAFPDSGMVYSSARRVSGFAGLTWRPRMPGADLALTARAARFVVGDRGLEFEARRSLGDLDVAYFAQLHPSGSATVHGVRLSIPIPPAQRAAGLALRVQPVARFPLELRNVSEPVGEALSGVASRADFLRFLSAPSLDAHTAAGSTTHAAWRAADAPVDWISAAGMTGFINTPWVGVLPDKALALGYHVSPRAYAYDHRGSNANEVYYATLGFLPRLETALRWTHMVGVRAFGDVVPDSRLPDVDRMASVRGELVTPRTNRPGLAIGIEDIEGTRRFHSTYAVCGVPLAWNALRGRATLGYGSRTLPAKRRTLDGTFGAFELSPWRRVAPQIEYDTEKWNAGLGLALPFGIQLHASLLHLESLALGAGWSVGL
jgi:hypothetical protein